MEVDNNPIREMATMLFIYLPSFIWIRANVRAIGYNVFAFGNRFIDLVCIILIDTNTLRVINISIIFFSYQKLWT